MKIKLRQDPNPDAEFYYDHQFRIYREPYLIWDRDTWRSILAACAVYRIEVNGNYAGDVILEERRRGTRYIVDFSILLEYQRMGVGRAVLEEIKMRERRLKAVTRKETLPFFLKSGFVMKKTIRNYYDSGVDGFYVVSAIPPTSAGSVH